MKALVIGTLLIYGGSTAKADGSDSSQPHDIRNP